MSEEIDVGQWYRQQQAEYLDLLRDPDETPETLRDENYNCFGYIFRKAQRVGSRAVLDDFYHLYYCKMCFIGVPLQMLINEVMVPGMHLLRRGVVGDFRLSIEFLEKIKEDMNTISSVWQYATRVKELHLSPGNANRAMIETLSDKHWRSIIVNEGRNPFLQVAEMRDVLEVAVNEIKVDLYGYFQGLGLLCEQNELTEDADKLKGFNKGYIYFNHLSKALKHLREACLHVCDLMDPSYSHR